LSIAHQPRSIIFGNPLNIPASIFVLKTRKILLQALLSINTKMLFI